MTVTNPPLQRSEMLDREFAKWRALVDADLKGASFDKKLVTRIPEGIALKPLYTRADLAGLDDLRNVPGAAPYLRGMRPLGYGSRPWAVAQETPGALADDYNRALLAGLMGGQNAVVLHADAAARAGLDPDQATATDVGRGGVSLADVLDVAVALQNVDLTAVPVHLTGGADAAPLAAMLLEHARRSGVRWAHLTGSVTSDPIAEWILLGNLPAPLDRLLDSMACWTKWVATHEPQFQTIAVNAASWHEAGGTVVHELAFALATAVEYLQALKERGVSVETAVAQMAFSFAIGPQFFLEVAKLRAFRALWTRVVVGFGAAPAAAAHSTIAATTGDWNKTVLDPHVNMLRVTTEAMSAVLGGCDRLHVSPFDDLTGHSTVTAERSARNVHVLLAEEFGVAETADPAGGSWYLESLTDQTARAAWALFQEIEGRGGMCAALRAGYPQDEISKAAAEQRAALGARRIALVGTNVFPNLRESALPVKPEQSDPPHRCLAAEIRLRRGADPTSGGAPRDGVAGFESLLTAARAGATVGQLSRSWWGAALGSEPIKPLTTWRAAEEVESLRQRSAAIAMKTGARPRVFLAKMGPAAQHKARADFVAGFFAVGGIEVLATAAFTHGEEAARAAVTSTAKVVCLCSTDETYPALVPEFAALIRTLSPDTKVLLAGRPADAGTLASFQAAGIHDFIHLRSDVSATLSKLLCSWEDAP